MPIYTLTLLDRKIVAKDTIIFIFSKPAQFTFIPGQFGGFTLPSLLKANPTMSTRRFSLLSTPSDNHIAIATRIQSSDYKRILNELAIGSEIKFAGPTGLFTLHETTSIPAVLIAGGIGITPFYSMIQHAVLQKTSQPIYLFYGNQTPAESVFLAELYTLQEKYPSLTFIPSMATHTDADGWKGETGFITENMIKKYVSDISTPIFYICGSPMMVKALHETLSDMGIHEERIKIEDFPGY